MQENNEYLDFLNMPHKYRYKSIPCDICGSDEFLDIREKISWNSNDYGKLPVKCCKQCGFLMQNPKFDKQFYHDYYSKSYREKTNGSLSPKQEYIDDQIVRGRLVFETLSHYMDSSKKYAVADIGSSVGGFLIPFKAHGWEVYGVDPDKGYVEYGQKTLGLNVEYANAEDMSLTENYFDVIIIMGSLEHVYDPNKVLKICRKASKPNALLVLEGRGKPRGLSKDYFNQSHHRYLSLNSIELIMIKHGWKPFYTTDERLCGPSRPTNIYSIGRVCDIPSKQEFLEIVKAKREDAYEILNELDELDIKIASVTK